MDEKRMTNKYFTDRQSDFESSARSYPRKFPFALKKAKGSWVEDVEGNRYLDFLCGAGTLALGHNDDQVNRAMIDLIESGAVTGSKKGNHIGRVTTGFVMGTDRLYNWIDDNPMFYFDSSAYTNDPYVISKNPRMVSINSALQVDLTGQVNADTFGPRQFSGVGGQVDFLRGAALSEGGIPIVALPSTASGGKLSRIVTSLDPGSSVTTSRWMGCTIVTEYGVASLWGKNTRQRAKALIEIAHPKFREQLAKDAAELYGTDYI